VTVERDSAVLVTSVIRASGDIGLFEEGGANMGSPHPSHGIQALQRRRTEASLVSWLLLTTTDRPSSSRGLNAYLGVDSHGAVPGLGLSVPHRDTSFGLDSPHVLRAFKRRYEYNHLRNLRSSQQKK
jgi:hypothetical protein